MTNMLTIPEAARYVREHDGYLLLSHRRPDGDTVGSCAALCRALRALGKRADVLENPQLTARYAPFLQGLTRPDVPEGATLVSVDVAAEDMLLPGAEGLCGSIGLALDHHESNRGFARCNCVRPDYAATGELIWELFAALELPLDAQSAGALYLAVSTDTGCFRYSNVTAHSFQAAAACCAAGADIFPINRAFFTVKTPARLRLESFLGGSMRFYAGGTVAVCALSRADMARLEATEDDADDLSGLPRSIEGVEIGVMLRENADGSGKISLRTGEGYNAAEFCRALGGGGHRAAAGASVPGGLEAAREAILGVLRAADVEL